MTQRTIPPTGASPLIALIVGLRELAWKPATVLTIDALSRAVDARGAGLMLVVDAETPSRALRNLTGSGLISGALIRSQAADHGWVRELSDSLPTVMIGAHREMQGKHVVEIENVESTSTLVGAMIDAGCERLAMVSGTVKRADSHLRLEGFRLAHRLRGRTCDDSLIFPGNYLRHGGYAIADMVLDTKPDGIFAANDETARGIIERAHERGLHVPRDFMIAGFDGTGEPGIDRIDLATVRTPWSAFADTAVETLFGLVAGMDMPRERLVSPEVRLGGTIRAATSSPAS